MVSRPEVDSGLECQLREWTEKRVKPIDILGKSKGRPMKSKSATESNQSTGPEVAQAEKARTQNGPTPEEIRQQGRR